MFEIMDSFPQSAVIKVIGVGGGGGNAIEHMVAADIEGAKSLLFFAGALGFGFLICLGVGGSKVFRPELGEEKSL